MKLIEPPCAIVPWTPYATGPCESMMLKLWSRLHEDHLYGTVFHEAPEMPLAGFITFFSKPTVAAQILVQVDQDGEYADVAGIAWLSEFEQLATHRRATGSFVLLRSHWGNGFPELFAPLLFPYWFEREPDGLGVDVLVGLTPAPNRRATAFCKRIGMRYTAVLEGYTTFGGRQCDAGLAIMTRKDYQARYCQNPIAVS